MSRSDKDPNDFHIEILDLDADRDIYDGSLEQNLINQLDDQLPQAGVRPSRRRPAMRRENTEDFEEEVLPPSPKEKARKKRNRQLTVLTYGFVALFLVMMGYLVYFNQVRARDYARNAHNARLDSMSEHVLKGSILDRNGNVLAKSETSSDGSAYRTYPYGELFAHVVGYDTKGKAGIEAAYNFEMLSSHAFIFDQIEYDLKGQKSPGDTIVTTLDASIQQAAASALAGSKGAVVAIEPDTGKILAMYSNPTYNPETVEANWDLLNSDEDSSLLNRATQGAYAPGSTFKIVSALEYIRENDGDSNYVFDCSGSFTYSDTTIHCFGNTVHGREDLRSSFANSCNSSFSNMGLHFKKSKFASTAKDFLFNKKLPGPFAAKKSKFAVNKDTGPGEMMMTAMGQGQTQISPYHLALIASVVANDGTLMRPYIVSRIENDQGKEVKTYSPHTYRHLIEADEAEILQDYMRSVVTEGTGMILNTTAYQASGKTGTAEYSSDKSKSHSLFTGYANAEHPDIAVAVVVENADTSGVSAVSIAKSVFDAYYSL